MPPIYEWECEKTGLRVDVLRSFDDYNKAPDDTDLPEDERGKERQWKKIIGNTNKHRKPYGWGTKGSWVILLAAIFETIRRTIL